MSLLTDLRLDVGDEDLTVVPTAATGVAGALTGILITNLRVDIADDDGIVNIATGPTGPQGIPGSGAAGPAITTIGAVAIWDNTIGTLLANSTVLINTSGTITIPGGQIIGGRISSSTGVIVNQTDYLLVLTASSDRIAYLPSSPIAWEVHTVKDGAHNASLYPITVSGINYNIDGAGYSIINSDSNSLTYVFNGVEWNIV